MRAHFAALQKRQDRLVHIALGDRPAEVAADDALAVDQIGLGHAGQAPVEAGPAVEVERRRTCRDRPAASARRSASVGLVLPGDADDRRRPRAAASRVNSGCSARQGVHQLAKKFTITGLPVRSSASVSGGSPSRSAVHVEARRRAADQHRADRRGIAAGQQRPGEEARHQRQRQPAAGGRGDGGSFGRGCTADRPCATARRCAGGGRESETKPPSAQSAAPSQIQGASGL